MSLHIVREVETSHLEVEAFSEVTCLLGLVLALSWFDHPASVCNHSEVVLLPVALT